MKKILLMVVLSFGLLSLVSLASCKNDEQKTSDKGSSSNQESSESSSSQGGGGSSSSEEEEIQKDRMSIYLEGTSSLKIMQFADLHFGDPTKPYHNGKVDETKAYMNYLKEVGRPDLIVCSGDNILSTGLSGLGEFVELMETFETPWTFVFGNHDSESLSGEGSKASMNEYLLNVLDETDYLIYKDSYEGASENRFGNFSIKVYTDDAKAPTLRGAIILMDTGIYNYEEGYYESITEGQVEWYKSEIDALQASYAGAGVVPTILFQHMQSPEFYTAYTNAKAGNEDATFVIEQDLTRAEILEIKNGAAAEDGGLFAAVKEKGSTKAIFVGHAHNYYFQVNYQGVLLGFAPQTGHSNTFAGDNNPRNTHMYEVTPTFEIATESIKEPFLEVSEVAGDVKAGGRYEIEYQLLNIEGEVEITSNDATLATFTNVDGKVVITALQAGEFVLTFKGPRNITKTFTLTIKPVNKYTLYAPNNADNGTFNGLFTALDELFVLGLGVGSYITLENSDVRVFELTNSAYNFMTQEGMYNGFDNLSQVTNGQAGWWQTYVADTSIFTQGNTNLFNSSTTSAAFGLFARPANFEVTNTDGSGGFQAGDGSPNSTWSGWQASVYKAGLSVAQFVGWADAKIDDKVIDQYVLEYDLTNSVMKPSANPNQPTRGDIWIGHSYLSGVDPIMLGVTFDAGTQESTKNLADGTKREWKLYTELLGLSGGLTTVTQGVRTLGETVGYSTWNAKEKVWESDFVITLDLSVVTNQTDNFAMTLKATVGETEKTIVAQYDAKIDASGFRLTYGINYTPDITVNNRKVTDITNGGYWLNTVQTKANAFIQGEEVRNIGFLAGRVTTSARQVGVYGSDVLTVKNSGGKAIFQFVY